MEDNGPDVLTVEYIDRATCRLDGDNDLLLSIVEFFSYYAKDYKHMPLFKRGIWDGKVKMFKVSDRKLPAGLLSRLYEHAKMRGYTVEIIGDAFPLIPFDDEFFLSDITPLTAFEVMNHQMGAVGDVLAYNTRLVLSPTSSGKSMIMYLAARYIMAKHKKRILIIVPNKTLVEQMREDFVEYATDGWGPTDIHAIYAEQEIWTAHDVVVSTYQTAVKLTTEWYEEFGAIFIDEAHGANSKSVTTILGNASHMLYCAGFTGTLNGTYMHEMEMRARFGDVTKLVTTKELMAMGIVAQLSIDAITLTHKDDETTKLAAKWTYAEEIEYLVNSAERNEFLANLATSEDKNVMILFHRTEHGQALKRLIQDLIAGSTKTLFYVDGNVDIKDRAPIRAAMEASDGCILLASYGTSSVGLSIKNIHFMVLGHPFKDRIRVLQTIGRILRISPTKKSAKVIDIGDHVSGKRKTPNATYDHFLQRLALYQEEGFDYDTVTIQGAI
jgi:superfamily II DNA or RNA helicase